MAEDTPKSERKPLEEEAEKGSFGLLGEFYFFLCESRKWWLLPILLGLLVLALVAAFGGSSATPFIYTLF